MKATAKYQDKPMLKANEQIESQFKKLYWSHLGVMMKQVSKELENGQ
jgi:hypothetical protein